MTHTPEAPEVPETESDTSDTSGIALSVPCEHGKLHGHLIIRPHATALIVLVHAAQALDERDIMLAKIFREAGFSTLNLTLLSAQEAHFSDVHHNVPLLAKRLLDFLSQIKQRMLMGEMPTQAMGLCAANDTSPVVLRVAAQRDHDIGALVCRSGLIDRAGILFLRSLESPLLMLLEEDDEQHIHSSRRALQEVTGRKALKLIPNIDSAYNTSVGFATAAHEAIEWFTQHLTHK